MQTLLSNVKFEEMIAHANRSAGTSDINGITVDMNGFEGCLIRLEMGAITASAVTTLKGQESDSSTGGWTEVDGAEISIAPDEDNVYVDMDVANIRKRFFRGVVERATANAGIRSAQYIKYNASFLPTSQPAADKTLILTPA